MQLVAEGKLKLTDTIDRWFPWVPNASQITIRNLGDMSGINTYTADPATLERYWGTAEDLEADRTDQERRLPGAQIPGRPGILSTRTPTS